MFANQRVVHFITQCRAVSRNISSTLDTKKVISSSFITDEGFSVKNVLVACKRAQELSSLASAASNNVTKMHRVSVKRYELNDVDRAAKTAEELLTLTSHPNFVHHLWKDCELRSKVDSIHLAFVSVTSWVLDISPVLHSKHDCEDFSRNVSSLVNSALQLSVRAEKLRLPLHLPLYSKLAVACAIHSNLPSSNIIKLMLSFRRTLNPDDEVLESILQKPLLLLVQEHRYHQVLQVLKAMKRTGYSIRYNLSSTLLTAMSDDKTTSFTDKSKDAHQLLLILLPVYTEASNEFNSMVKTILAVNDMNDNENFFKDSELGYDDFDDENEENVSKFSNHLDHKYSSGTVSTSSNIDEMQSNESLFYPSTDRGSWRIPDLTPQLKNGVIELTDEYEAWLDSYDFDDEDDDHQA